MMCRLPVKITSSDTAITALRKVKSAAYASGWTAFELRQLFDYATASLDPDQCVKILNDFTY